MSNKTEKKSGFFNVFLVKNTRYVSFSSNNVSVDLNKFLSTDKGRRVVENAAKNKKIRKLRKEEKIAVLEAS